MQRWEMLNSTVFRFRLFGMAKTGNKICELSRT